MLNISELVKMKQKKIDYWRRKYKLILNKCYKRINYYARHGYEECLFEIPTLVFGMPVYDIQECLQFIIEKLKQYGLRIQIVDNQIIHISWKEHSPTEPKFMKTARQIKEAKIIQALPAPPTPKPAQVVEVQRPMQPVDYFTPSGGRGRTNPVIQAASQYGFSTFSSEDVIPQRNMNEPLLAPRPSTTRTREVFHERVPEQHIKRKPGRPRKYPESVPSATKTPSGQKIRFV